MLFNEVLLSYINDFITTTFSKFMHKIIKEINKVIVKNYTLLKASYILFQGSCWFNLSHIDLQVGKKVRK